MSALLHMLGLDADHRVPWRNHYVTGPEVAAVAENRRANPPPGPAERRYLHWLRLSDVCDLTFGEYLRRQLYNDPTYGAP